MSKNIKKKVLIVFSKSVDNLDDRFGKFLVLSSVMVVCFVCSDPISCGAPCHYVILIVH